MQFAVVRKPGHRNHEMLVYSSHMTAEAAKKSAKKRGEAFEVVECINGASPCKGRPLFDDSTGRHYWRQVA